MIATIAPKDVPLQIKAFVNTNDINKIEVGQSTQMRVSACPHPDYGVLSGRVKDISADVISTEVNPFEGNVQNNPTAISRYTVMIQPQKTQLEWGNNICKLQTGMDVQTDIISNEETVLQFILRKAKLIQKS